MGGAGGGAAGARSSIGSMGMGGARSSVGGGGGVSRVARSGTDSAGGVSNARLLQGQGMVRPTLAAPTYVTRGADTRHLM
jgi:hypothetical protein